MEKKFIHELEYGDRVHIFNINDAIYYHAQAIIDTDIKELSSKCNSDELEHINVNPWFEEEKFLMPDTFYSDLRESSPFSLSPEDKLRKKLMFYLTTKNLCSEYIELDKYIISRLGQEGLYLFVNEQKGREFCESLLKQRRAAVGVRTINEKIKELNETIRNCEKYICTLTVMKKN